MYSYSPIAVIIATSKSRTELLYKRSLRSVYLQKNVNPREIVIVDDNPVKEDEEYSYEFERIKAIICKLRKEILELSYQNYVRNKTTPPSFDNYFRTTLLKNTRTKGHSGTGAWNTAIFYLANKYKERQDFFIAILDDDDQYDNNYLATCCKIIQKKKNSLAAIFPHIIWKTNNGELLFSFDKKDITQQNFFIGNPGIQGSNMCIRCDILFSIRGFDETLHSATDRDLMIRFLDFLDEYNSTHTPRLTIEVIHQPLVIYHTDCPDRVTVNKILKKKGLDVFYGKYRHRFSREDFSKSLQRAKELFGYEF